MPLVLVLVLLAVPAGTAAQSFLWAGYGRNADDASGPATGEHLTLGYQLWRPGGSFAIAVGIPSDPDASSRWAGLAGQFNRAPVKGPLGFRGSASLFGFADPVLDTRAAGTVAALEAYGLVNLVPATVELRAGARHGSHALAEDLTHRLLGRVGATAGLTHGVLELRADVDHWRAEEGGYTQAGARVALMERRIQAWAGVDRWLDGDLGGTGWEAGVRVPTTERVAVVARTGLQVADILFWIPAQRTWSVGLQLRTGPAPGLVSVAGPVVREARRPIALTLPAEGRTAPAVAGSFSDWERIPMERHGDQWRVQLTLGPGVYEYAFVAADGTWFVPEGTPGRKPDGFGGHVAVLIVQ